MTDAMKITASILKEWRACTDGFRRFCELFPDGADLKTAAKGLQDDGHAEWSIWLYDQSRNDERFKDQAKEGFANTGHWNTGDWNTGDSNTGDWNTGHSNTGDWNTGHWNTGHRNTGHWNTGHRNTGYFNTITPEDILVFNKPCARATWDNCKKPDFICNIRLTYWVPDSEMTDEEKKADPNFWARGGQLRRRDYKEAWRLAWETASASDKALLKQLPNFSSEVFLEITGIDLTDEAG